ncbi:hypothetical protein F6Q07_22035 [Pectobacterium parmentieri]|uniref:hypothetical protein n=1 Tax=Pectobacterium parmentieri TaxID=1905730 RepID=UPI000EAC1D7B|nr:hypothetical protein [Pectobacterium parmentieri]AYH33247.1 hypothetical protein C5E19_17355 [Pectobacterium parmentieri]MBI0520759.1 hypothetical protein [Pectobacterium parmentieri]RKO74370.1 hypothetical protein C5E04_18800 [Pectobacterium parmentieri]
MTHQIPAYATSELLRLEREIAEHEKAIALKNERRREIINRYSLNKPDAWEEEKRRVREMNLADMRASA